MSGVVSGRGRRRPQGAVGDVQNFYNYLIQRMMCQVLSVVVDDAVPKEQ